tara:strand:+ start:270 stop:713 length:444 start_codon:yes stop_codon:yes gene_type:complete
MRKNIHRNSYSGVQGVNDEINWFEGDNLIQDEVEGDMARPEKSDSGFMNKDQMEDFTNLTNRNKNTSVGAVASFANTTAPRLGGRPEGRDPLMGQLLPPPSLDNGLYEKEFMHNRNLAQTSGSNPVLPSPEASINIDDMGVKALYNT